MRFIPYNTDLKEFSRQLRNNSTRGEVMLWKKLRVGQMMGYTFNRQKPLGNYIVDFYCKPLNLVIEIDGGSHHIEDIIVKDAERQAILERMGLHLLRFTEKRVRFELPYVVLDIQRHIEALKEGEL
jgi:very-short-patch-repair endonuclease